MAEVVQSPQYPTVDLNNVQGDLFSRGFPKYHETYYFFSINDDQQKEFVKRLNSLVSPDNNQISTLRKVLDDWAEIEKAGAETPQLSVRAERKLVPISNVLIAFTKSGLDEIQTGTPFRDLGLDNLTLSDPAFNRGMINDVREDGSSYTNDPPPKELHTLFKNDAIHGLLKIAGDSAETVENRLREIKDHLGHSAVIDDMSGKSEPTELVSRVDGHVRPRTKGVKGREHFGFRDGLSQPLIRGINSDEQITKDPRMETPRNIILVSKNPPGTQDGIVAHPTKRPAWMIDGSFLVFRKLEQDVKAWNDFVKEKYKAADCLSPEHLGAKLMGRWPSGASIVRYPDEDPHESADLSNDFDYKHVKLATCPLGAHLRKVNPRVELDAIRNARLIRNGIPYGSEYDERPTDKRGLLFVCYQSSIENGFRFVQENWSNRTSFPRTTTGHDPLIGQAPMNGKLHTAMHDRKEAGLDPGLGEFDKTVTMKGGEYFFVPSISALRDIFGKAEQKEQNGTVGAGEGIPT